MWKQGSSLRTAVSSLLLICGILVVNTMLASFPVPAAAQENLVENGDFSQGLEHWIVGGPTNPCEPGNPSEPGGYYGCVMVTDEGTPGNPHLELWTGTGGEYGMERFEQGVFQTFSRLPKDSARITLSLRVWSLGNHSTVHLELHGGFQSDVFQEVHLPEDATGVSLSIKAWGLTLPGQNPENVWPWVMVRITRGGAVFNGTGEQETYSFGKRALGMEPASTITRDLTGFKGKNITLTIMGEEAAVDDATVLATRSYFGFPTTISGLITVAAIILAAFVGAFLGFRHGLSVRVQGMKGPVVEGELPKSKEFGNRIVARIGETKNPAV